MKIQVLLEMPEIIPQDDISLPLKNVQVKTILWTCPLSNPELTLAAHPIRGSAKGIMIMAYKGTPGDPSKAVAAMFMAPDSVGRYHQYGVQVAKSARGQGIAVDMYTAVAKHKGFTLVSDDVQTEGGSAIWQSLNKRFPGSVSVLDGNNGTIPLDRFEGDAFRDPMTQLVFSLNNQADIKKSA